MKDPLLNTGNRNALEILQKEWNNSSSPQQIINKQNNIYDTTLLIDRFKKIQGNSNTLNPIKSFKKHLSLHKEILSHLKEAPILDFTSDEQALEEILKELEQLMQAGIVNQELAEKNVLSEQLLPTSEMTHEDKVNLLETLGNILERSLALTLLGQAYSTWPGTLEQKNQALLKVFPSKNSLSIPLESKVEQMKLDLEKAKEASIHRTLSSNQNNDTKIEQEEVEALVTIYSFLDTNFEQAMFHFTCLASQERKPFFHISQKECLTTYRPFLHLYAIHALEKPNEVKDVIEPRMYGQNALFNINNCKASNEEIKRAFERTIVELALQGLAKGIWGQGEEKYHPFMDVLKTIGRNVLEEQITMRGLPSPQMKYKAIINLLEHLKTVWKMD